MQDHINWTSVIFSQLTRGQTWSWKKWMDHGRVRSTQIIDDQQSGQQCSVLSRKTNPSASISKTELFYYRMIHRPITHVNWQTVLFEFYDASLAAFAKLVSQWVRTRATVLANGQQQDCIWGSFAIALPICWYRRTWRALVSLTDRGLDWRPVFQRHCGYSLFSTSALTSAWPNDKERSEQCVPHIAVLHEANKVSHVGFVWGAAPDRQRLFHVWECVQQRSPFGNVRKSSYFCLMSKKKIDVWN